VPQPADPTSTAASAAAKGDTADETLPIAGAAGAAILLLGGGAYALTRRRRRDENEYRLEEEVGMAEPSPAVSEAMATGAMAPPTVAPATMAAAAKEAPIGAAHGDAPVTGLPAGFDMSRYGRHVQAAYRGPTAENPSLSLRRRLARARFFDQRERLAGEVARAAPVATPASPNQQPATPARQGEFVTSRIKQPPRPGFRPAYSS
jgi:LPXTG-motif cell wall-anchored protein